MLRKEMVSHTLGTRSCVPPKFKWWSHVANIRRWYLWQLPRSGRWWAWSVCDGVGGYKETEMEALALHLHWGKAGWALLLPSSRTWQLYGTQEHSTVLYLGTTLDSTESSKNMNFVLTALLQRDPLFSEWEVKWEEGEVSLCWTSPKNVHTGRFKMSFANDHMSIPNFDLGITKKFVSEIANTHIMRTNCNSSSTLLNKIDPVEIVSNGISISPWKMCIMKNIHGFQNRFGPKEIHLYFHFLHAFWTLSLCVRDRECIQNQNQLKKWQARTIGKF